MRPRWVDTDWPLVRIRAGSGATDNWATLARGDPLTCPRHWPVSLLWCCCAVVRQLLCCCSVVSGVVLPAVSPPRLRGLAAAAQCAVLQTRSPALVFCNVGPRRRRSVDCRYLEIGVWVREQFCTGSTNLPPASSSPPCHLSSLWSL